MYITMQTNDTKYCFPPVLDTRGRGGMTGSTSKGLDTSGRSSSVLGRAPSVSAPKKASKAEGKPKKSKKK